MKHKFLLLYAWFIRIILFPLPDVPFIMRFRGWLYGLAMKKCGKDFQVSHDVVLKSLENIQVGVSCFVGNHSVLMGSGTIVIGNEVLLAPHVVVISGNHTYSNGSFKNGKGDIGEIVIGNGCWIAANCTIQRNTKLPNYSVLSANSFLNKYFSTEHSLYGGVPARLLKTMK